MTKTPNIGAMDKKIRLAAGVLLIAFAVVLHVGGPLGVIAGLVLLATVQMNWCPVYSAIGMDTLHKG